VEKRSGGLLVPEGELEGRGRARGVFRYCSSQFAELRVLCSFPRIVAVSSGNFGADWSWEVRAPMASLPFNFYELLLVICLNSRFVRFFMGG